MHYLLPIVSHWKLWGMGVNSSVLLLPLEERVVGRDV